MTSVPIERVSLTTSPALLPSSSITTTDGTTSTTLQQPRHIVNLYVSSVAYNIITFTDGALRAIVLLFLVSLGFSAISLAVMFSLYELMGVFMNFYGGVLGARYGMRFLLLLSVSGQLTCVILLAPLQVVFPDITNSSERNTLVITVYVVVAQMLSGVSKDLMKIQGKSVPKLVTKVGDDDELFKIISVLTGMKNSIKGIGYLIGSVLLFYVGWVGALCVQGALLFLIYPPALRWMENDLGISKKAEEKARVRCSSFRKGWNVNVLSLARFFLFGSRDVWFEVAAPYFFRSVLHWAPFSVGAFMAGYTIIYGQLQALTSQMFHKNRGLKRLPTRWDVPFWAGLNFIEITALSIGTYFTYQTYVLSGNPTSTIAVLLVGICIFAALFAVSSAVHSYLIVTYSNRDKVSMDVGFYYMSNAGGRMVGTLISGFIYTYTVETYGLSVCLWVASGFMLISTFVSFYLREHQSEIASPAAAEVMMETLEDGPRIKTSEDVEPKKGKDEEHGSATVKQELFIV